MSGFQPSQIMLMRIIRQKNNNYFLKNHLKYIGMKKFMQYY